MHMHNAEGGGTHADAAAAAAADVDDAHGKAHTKTPEENTSTHPDMHIPILSTLRVCRRRFTHVSVSPNARSSMSSSSSDASGSFL